MVTAGECVTDLMQHGLFIKMTQEHGILLMVPPAHGMRDISLEAKVRVDSNPVDLELFFFCYLIQQCQHRLP